MTMHSTGPEIASPGVMRIRYPKSFFKLLFVGFVLAMLPLVAGLVGDTVAIRRLAGQGHQAVFAVARIAQGSRQVADSVTGLERSALQWTVLKDDDLRHGYLARHAQFVTRVESLRSLPMEADMQRLLDDLAQSEDGIRNSIADPAVAALSASQLADRFAHLFDLSRQLLVHADAAIEREAEAMRTLAQQTELRAWWLLAIAAPLALLLIAGFIHLLTRPISQIEAGIRGLGEHRFDEKIVVDGPEDLQQLGRRLEWLRLRLSQLEEQKSRFLRHVSHELKTPLTALREGSDLLAEGAGGPLAPRQHEIVAILRENSVHLQKLIEGLLRQGEAEFRESSLKIQSIEPARLMADVEGKQRIALDARDLRLRISGGDFTMQTDPDRLRLILENLLSNAVKYSPAGGTIDFVCEKSRDFVRLRLLDEGPGVAPADRPFVFDPFYRGAAPAAGPVKGTGLGLSICRDHVQALGGSIEVGTGRGDFTVTLPRSEP